MYWLESVVLHQGEIVDEAFLADWTLAATIAPLPLPAALLLVHVEVTEDGEGHTAYTGLTVLACQLADAERQALMSLTPVIELHPHEQQVLRQWLTCQRWLAWARASHGVRSRLGAPDLPVSLSEAARQMMIPLPTLQSAAAEERLPTIRAADRQLIYVDTIIEAQARGLLHYGRGRPARHTRVR